MLCGLNYVLECTDERDDDNAHVVVIRKPNDGSHQLWRFEPLTNHCAESWGRLRNKKYNTVLQVCSNGNVVCARERNIDTQLWKFEPATKVGLPLRQRVSTKMVAAATMLNMTGPLGRIATGIASALKPETTVPPEIAKRNLALQHLFCFWKNLASEKCLDVTGSKAVDGTTVCALSLSQRLNQCWMMVKAWSSQDEKKRLRHKTDLKARFTQSGTESTDDG